MNGLLANCNYNLKINSIQNITEFNIDDTIVNSYINTVNKNGFDILKITKNNLDIFCNKYVTNFFNKLQIKYNKDDILYFILRSSICGFYTILDISSNVPSKLIENLKNIYEQEQEHYQEHKDEIIKEPIINPSNIINYISKIFSNNDNDVSYLTTSRQLYTDISGTINTIIENIINKKKIYAKK